jgi:hypothetical protein
LYHLLFGCVLSVRWRRMMPIGLFCAVFACVDVVMCAVLYVATFIFCARVGRCAASLNIHENCLCVSTLLCCPWLRESLGVRGSKEIASGFKKYVYVEAFSQRKETP